MYCPRDVSNDVDSSTVATGITARGEIVGDYSGEVSHGFI
jgi:hypothetical protein